MAARRSKAKTGTVKVNFKGVESRKTPKEGDYIVEVLEANSGKSANGNDQIEFVLEIAKGEYKGVKLWFYCPLQENSLWKLHAFLTALGEDVPEDEMEIDLSDLIGKQCVGVLTHETYNGKKRAKMTDFDTLDNYSGGDSSSDDDEDDDEDDKPKNKKGAKEEPKGKKKAEPKKVLKSAVNDMDRDEMLELIEEHDLEDIDHKSKKFKKDDDALREAILEALDEGDLLEDDTKKAKGKEKASSKKAKKYTSDEIEDMDEDELQEVIDKHGLDVDLDDFKKIGKKQAAVVDALEGEDLMEEDD